ncbi:MAG: penicillin-binding transpeptidase domain-containing protein [Balneolaceae bacterium]|nr:penicillin-binding transpeptidase domain-containing protein [Balneolaceae bacterium]
MYPVFEDVVADSGTARWAQVEGLKIAGKTGTAKKFIDGRYRMAYRASFVGFFPADNPKYVCLVVLDEPQTSIYGGYTAGVIFKQTATRIAGLDNEILREIEESDPNKGEAGPHPGCQKYEREAKHRPCLNPIKLSLR